jgi:type IV pilus assembly protein PilM
MRWMFNRVKVGTKRPGRPRTAVEIAPEGVVAASLPVQGRTLLYALEPLGPGVVVPGIVEQNLRPPEVVVEAICSTLKRAAQGSRVVTLILPDAAVRVFVLDFDTLPAKEADLIAVLRFRLRKMVSFDVERAGITYQILSQPVSACRVLVTILPGAILEEYESAVRKAGYEPGFVLPSSMAALHGLDSPEPVLAAFLSGSSFTTSITNGQDLLLYRRVDLPDDQNLRVDELKRDVAVAMAYFEDNLKGPPQRLHYAGIEGARAFSCWIKEPHLPVLDLAPLPETSATIGPVNASIAGVTGALAGAE